MLHEKRESKRLDIFHVIEIKSQSPILGLIRNFSYQGFTIELDSIDFEQKENIEFKLKYPHGNLIVSFLGDVVWEKRDANTFSAGIKVRELDKESKQKLIEILCAIGEIPLDVFNNGNNSDNLMRERKEEKLKAKLQGEVASETSKHYKGRISPIFITTLYLAIFLFGIIALKEVIVPVSKHDYQATNNKQLPELESNLIKPVKEQSVSIISDKDGLSNKDKETKQTINKNTIQKRSDNNIYTANEINTKLKVDEQYASRLVYTIQIETQLKLADAQKQFNYLLRTLKEKNRNLLRIEKIGKYYTLRLGKFENYKSAKNFLQAMPPQLSEAIILKAHIKNERIIRL
jgi:hypothetical protein